MIGIDIIEIDRVEAKCRREGFVKRAFTEHERQYWKASGTWMQTLAGFFAAKEAVAKALGVGFNVIDLLEIEISHTLEGQPQATLTGAAGRIAGGRQVNISISHNESTAVAVCVLI